MKKKKLFKKNKQEKKRKKSLAAGARANDDECRHEKMEKDEIWSESLAKCRGGWHGRHIVPAKSRWSSLVRIRCSVTGAHKHTVVYFAYFVFL
jgi:hypothetical protein